MKKLFLPLLLVLGLGATQQVSAQVDVTINPLGLLFGDLSIGADLALGNKASVELQAGYGSKKFESASYKWSNIPINAVGKYYFNPNHGADRFYADVFARFINRSYKYDDSTFGSNYKATRVGVGFGLGYKVVSGGGFVFDINLGAGRALVDKQKYEDTNGTQTTLVDWPKIMFQGKLGIGYRFGGGKK